MPTSKQWWTAATCACVGDVGTTWYAMQHLGLPEQNPVVAELLATVGVLSGLVVSKLFVLAFGAVMWHVIDDHQWALPAIITVLYGLVFVLNTIQIAIL